MDNRYDQKALPTILSLAEKRPGGVADSALGNPRENLQGTRTRNANGLTLKRAGNFPASSPSTSKRVELLPMKLNEAARSRMTFVSGSLPRNRMENPQWNNVDQFT